MSAPVRINKLKAAMHGMAGAQDSGVVALPIAQPAPPSPTRATLAQSRQGKRNVSAYVNATAAKQLRMLSVERDTSTMALIEEALNDLFRKYGKSAIA